MLYIVTGASGSGKSEYAENLAVKMSCGHDLYYVATMQPFGEEGQERIRRHHVLRAGKGFTTIECYTDIGQVPGRIVREAGGDCRRATFLLECMSNLLANEMFREEKPQACVSEKEKERTQACASVLMKDADTYEELPDKLLSEIASLAKKCKHLIVVTNEVFSDGIRYAPETESYKEKLAKINRLLVEQSDEALEIIYTIPMSIKHSNIYARERKTEGKDIYESFM